MFKKITLTVLLSLILGAIGLYAGTIYGGNYGCFTTFFGLKGYEACGNIFAIIGILLGILLGITVGILYKKHNKHPLK